MSLLNFLRCAVCLNILSLLAGCHSVKDIRSYQVKSEEKTAKIRTDDSFNPKLRYSVMGCTDNEKGYKFLPDNDGYVRIPANERFNIVESQINGAFVCTVRLSFIPEENMSYQFKFINKYCSGTIIKENHQEPSLEITEPTLQRGKSCSYFWKE